MSDHMSREDRIAATLQFQVIEDAIEAHIASAHPDEPYLQHCPECIRLEARENAFIDERARMMGAGRICEKCGAEYDANSRSERCVNTCVVDGKIGTCGGQIIQNAAD